MSFAIANLQLTVRINGPPACHPPRGRRLIITLALPFIFDHGQETRYHILLDDETELLGMCVGARKADYLEIQLSVSKFWYLFRCNLKLGRLGGSVSHNTVESV